MAAIKVSIYRRTGGKYFQAKWVDPASSRTKQKSTKTNIRRDAERFAARLEKELNDGTYFEQTKTKWSDFRERYETEVIPGMAEKSAINISIIFNHVQRIVRPNLLKQVDSNAISKIVKGLRKRGLEEISIKSYLAHLKASLNWAASMKSDSSGTIVSEVQPGKGSESHERASNYTGRIRAYAGCDS